MTHFQRDRAVSPVVAVILMVAVTVILSAVIGTFVLNLGQSTTDTANQNDIGLSTSQSNGQYTATIITGSADEVKLLVNGTEVDNVTDPSAGDTLTANTSSGDRVTIVTVNDGEKTVVSSSTVGDSSTTSTVSGPTAPTSDLVSYWTMDLDDISGSTLIDTSGSNNGTISGAQTNVTGVQNEALGFDGNDDVTVPSDSSFNVSNVTVSVWVYWDGTTPQLYDPNVVNGHTYILRVNSVNSNGAPANFYITANGNRYSLNSPNDTPTNAWTHYVGTYDGETLRLYRNGTLVNETTTPSGPLDKADKSVMFAQDQNGDNGFSGRIDDVRIYNRSLNKSEVKDLYNATK